jgi:4-hydroxythreonine-4-phosphate dehydrogenase
MRKPTLGITMGDPASIGPEISVKALSDKNIYECCKPIIIGDAAVLEKAAEIVGMQHIKINPVKSVSEAKFEYGTIDVYEMALLI